MENLIQNRKKQKQQKPLLVYHRRIKRTTETPCKEVALNNNNKHNKPIIVYRRKRRRITTDFNAVKLEGQDPDSPIVFTSITDFESTRSNVKSDGLELLGCGEIEKKRAYDLRSTRISRSAESQLSAIISKEAKPDVSTTSDLNGVQRAKRTPRPRRRYLKYSTLLKNTSYGIGNTEVIEYRKDSNAYKDEGNCMAILKNASYGIHCTEFIEYRKDEVYKEAEDCMANFKNTSYGIRNGKFFEYGNDFDIYKEVEDYMGDERKHKITRTIESLYALPIVFEDFCMKHRI